MALAKKVTVGDYWARAIRKRPKRGPHDGRLYWRVESRSGSKLVHHHSRWMSRSEIKDLLLQMVASGEIDTLHEPSDTEVQTVRSLLEHWVGFQMERGESDVTSSWKKNCHNSARRLVKVMGTKPLALVTDADLLQYRTRRLKEGGASRTVHQDIKMWRSAWQWGQMHGFCPDRKAPTVKVNVEDVREKPIPTVSDVHQVLDALTRRRVAWPYLATLIALHTGARTGEIANLTWRDVDFENSRIRFVTRKNKTDKSRYRMVSEEVMASIQRHGAPGKAQDGIFGVTSKMVTANWSQKYLKSACEAAGVLPFTPYGLRRLSIQMDARNGINMGHTAKRHGNSVGVIAAHYQQFNADDERAAFRKTLESRQRIQAPFPKNAHKKRAQNTPPQTKSPPQPYDCEGRWHIQRESNPQPLDPKSSALSN